MGPLSRGASALVLLATRRADALRRGCATLRVTNAPPHASIPSPNGWIIAFTSSSSVRSRSFHAHPGLMRSFSLGGAGGSDADTGATTTTTTHGGIGGSPSSGGGSTSYHAAQRRRTKAILIAHGGTPNELFLLLREHHVEYTGWDVAATWTALHRIVANKGRGISRAGKDTTVAADDLALLTRTTTTLAPRMNGQDVAQVLWGMAQLADLGVDLDVDACGVITAEAPRVAAGMNAQDVSMTLLAWGDLAKKHGVRLDQEAVGAMFKEVPRVVGAMKPKYVHDALWGLGKLAENGVPVDEAAARAVTSATRRAAADMRPVTRRTARKLNGEDASNMMWAWGKLKEKGVNTNFDPKVFQQAV